MTTKRIEWKVHTVNLLREILVNPELAVMAQPLNIFGKLLAQVAERAIVLNDPALNILMLRLTLYEQADPEKFSYRQIQTAYAKQRKRLTAKGPTR